VSQQVLRDRAGGEQQVTPFELFFDLVFVFSVTPAVPYAAGSVITGGAVQTLTLDQVGSDGRA
jgi:low temperature requirement protein LtrA